VTRQTKFENAIKTSGNHSVMDLREIVELTARAYARIPDEEPTHAS
jgi:hypothetical protein